jgi:hydrogenase expression/formation protein HypE
MPDQSHGSVSCPVDLRKEDVILLGHGSGGKMTHDLISSLFLQAFRSPELARQDDQAVLEISGVRLAFTTDSYVVDPIFFPGGNIGDLAINGTINDLCMSGAKPLYISVAFIIEEGLAKDDLKRVVASMEHAAREAGVQIVTGDTKVVNKGKGDKLYLNTAGIGVIEHSFRLGPHHIVPGDRIILSGTVADHGVSILSRREGLPFESSVESDTAALHELTALILEAGGAGVHAMRDPTRGGVAATLNEFAQASRTSIRIYEERIPLRPEVAAACEILGLDPLNIANEGKLVAVVSDAASEKVLQAMRSHPLGSRAEIIGEVTAEQPGLVSIKTRIGGWRIVDMPSGEQLPRIC